MEMIHVKALTFNPFQENTYIVYNDDKEAIIFDPGCIDQSEREVLIALIEREDLKPTRLVNTHCHIDHVLGNKYVAEKYSLKLEAHTKEVPMLAANEFVSKMYSMVYQTSPNIEILLDEGDQFLLGKVYLEIFLCPGHSPGSLCFYHSDSNTLIGGDVLFQGSIGRTDLPGGDHNTLINVIKEKLFTLPDNTVVYPGHGPRTTIGIEKRTNPFLV